MVTVQRCISGSPEKVLHYSATMIIRKIPA